MPTAAVLYCAKMMAVASRSPPCGRGLSPARTAVPGLALEPQSLMNRHSSYAANDPGMLPSLLVAPANSPGRSSRRARGQAILRAPQGGAASVQSPARTPGRDPIPPHVDACSPPRYRTPQDSCAKSCCLPHVRRNPLVRSRDHRVHGVPRHRTGDNLQKGQLELAPSLSHAVGARWTDTGHAGSTMSAMEVPAAWEIARGADREKAEDVVRRLGERLGIAAPEIRGEYVLLPADYPSVARALDEVEPGWRDESLLIPPVP